MKKLAVSFILSAAILTPSITAHAAPNKADLNAYLKSISMTQSELEDYLSYNYDETLDDFKSVKELKETLGDPLTPQTLKKLLAKYHMTEQEVTKLAIENGEMEKGDTLLGTFYFVSDVEDIINVNQSDMGAFSPDGLSEIFSKIGVTETELNNLTEYLTKVTEQDPSIQSKLEALMEQSQNLTEVSDTKDLTPEMLAQIAHTVKELQSLLKIDVKVYTDVNGTKTHLSLKDFLSMDSLDNQKFIVEIYSADGKLLLDAILSDDLFKDGFYNDIAKETTKIVAKPTAFVPKTENGGKLPKTAGHYLDWSIVGLLIMLGSVVLRKKMFTAR
jgi:processed acidic surface protein